MKKTVVIAFISAVFLFVAWRAAFRESGFSTTHWLAAGLAAGLGGFAGYLVGRRAWPSVVLGDRHQRHELPGVGGGHLRAVV